MRVAFVTELFAPSVGGQEMRFQELGAELVKREHQVDLYTIRHDLSTPAYEQVEGVGVHRLTDCAAYKHPRFRRHPSGILRFTAALWARRAELARYDAVIFNIWPILPALVLGPVLGDKAVVDVCETRSGSGWFAIYRLLSRIPGVRILGVSPEIVRHMQREHGTTPDRAHVTVSGVDLVAAPRPPFAKNARRLMFFGRLTEHKNPSMLAEAFRRSSLPSQGYELVIAGGGPELLALRDTYASESIRLTGRVSDDEKWQWLQSSALLILPSRREGFPRVVAEAACVGTPTLTLAYPDNGTRFVVDDYGLGRSVPATLEALTQALEDYARNPAPWQELGREALTRSREEFGWEHVTSRLLDFLSPRLET